MFTRLSPSRLHLLRLLMLVLVGCGVVGSGLANALNDIHQLAHASDGADAHAHDDTATVDADGGDGDLLHVLVHCGHCHGHGGVLPMAVPAWHVGMVSWQPRLTAPPGQLPPSPAENLLRPPITA